MDAEKPSLAHKVFSQRRQATTHKKEKAAKKQSRKQLWCQQQQKKKREWRAAKAKLNFSREVEAQNSTEVFRMQKKLDDARWQQDKKIALQAKDKKEKERQKENWHPLFGGSYDVVPMGENRWLSK